MNEAKMFRDKLGNHFRKCVKTEVGRVLVFCAKQVLVVAYSDQAGRSTPFANAGLTASAVIERKKWVGKLASHWQGKKLFAADPRLFTQFPPVWRGNGIFPATEN